jgi:hypothetical protein
VSAATPAPLTATLRVATTDVERDAAVAAWLQSPAAGAAGRRAVLVEGALFDRRGPQDVPLVGLGAGCPCCTGSAALRVALGRTLRAVRPQALLLLLAAAEHLPHVRRILEGGDLGVRFEVEA